LTPSSNPTRPMTTMCKPVSTCCDTFCYDTVVTALLFIRSAAPAAVRPLTTMHDDWYPLTDTPKTRPPELHVLPTDPEALGEVATPVGESVTMLATTRGDVAARFTCSCLQLAEGRIGFEITV
jgi:hypothetical protein